VSSAEELKKNANSLPSNRRGKEKVDGPTAINSEKKERPKFTQSERKKMGGRKGGGGMLNRGSL